VTDTAPPVRPLIAFAGRDPHTATASLAGMYAGKEWYSRRLNEDYWYKYVGVGDDHLSIRRFQMHGYLRGDVATSGEVVVQWIETGRARLDIGHHAIRMEPGIPTMFPVDRRFHMEYENWDQRLVHVSRALLNDVAAEEYLLADGVLTFDHLTTPDPTVIQSWRRTVADAVRALREAGDTSLRWHEAQRDVARTLLRLYPLRAGLPTGYYTRNNVHVRAAVDFIHAHAHEPLTVTSIADASGLSIRGLQESFQRVLERTPMEYLREVRLDHAHAELTALTPSTATVSDIARRWGFGHMGRFSAGYVARYGQYPRETLRS
jgi:AraC-like DNA-binding protein